MLTLHNTPDTIEIAQLYDNDKDKNAKPVFWYPKKEEQYKMGVDDVANFLKSEKFRDYYKLSLLEATAIGEALQKGHDVPVGKKGLHNKFFKVKRDLERRLYTEMDIGDSAQFLRVDFPEDIKEWSGLHITIGSSGSGKTYHTVDLCRANLRGPREQRRQFVYASTELSKDKTLTDFMTCTVMKLQSKRRSSTDVFPRRPQEFWVLLVRPMRSKRWSLWPVKMPDH